MPFAIGSFAAFVALAAGVLSHVDPITIIWRGALAFAVGWVCASIWQAVVGLNRVDVEPSNEPASIETAESS